MNRWSVLFSLAGYFVWMLSIPTEGNEISDYGREKEKLRSLLAKEVVPTSLEENYLGSSGSTFRYLNKPEGDEIVLRSVVSEGPKYLNEWLVHLTGGESVAKEVVEELGYRFVKSVTGFPDIYSISHKHKHHNSKREAVEVTEHINSHMKVLWAEQQVARKRVKRRVLTGKEYEDRVHQIVAKILEQKKYETMFNDKLWPHQWYLFDSRTREDLPKLDLNVIPVWASGITGKGVQILVVDDGIEWTHEDLKNSYDPSISYDLNDDDTDPSPRIDSYITNSHGTKCAGEIAMQPNNTKCGVGVAFGAKIGGIRALDGDVTDFIEGSSLARNLDNVDIVSCSWGPADDGRRFERPGKLTALALKMGVSQGRRGKGIIYVWASGNGGSNMDNCNCDGYSSSIFTISVGSATESGLPTWYGERCSSTLTSAYSSGGYTDQKITTTDTGNKCTSDFTGTSAAAPLGAGVIALVLEANPDLTWRDVQHAVVLSSDWKILSRDDEWQTNARGLHFNSKLGFGLLNAEVLVNNVRKWKSVPEKMQKTFQTDVESSNQKISSGNIVEVLIEVDFENSNETIAFLEHVELVVTLQHSRRGSLGITLGSPSGTTTDVLTPRKMDTSQEGLYRWSLMSVHTWGENPLGQWKVTIQDTSSSDESGSLDEVLLVLHGTAVEPEIFTQLITNH